MDSIHKKTAIVGVAESDLGRVPHKSKYQLSAEASRAALDDAGLSIKDVDGLFTTIITEGGEMSSLVMAEYMGIRPRYTDSTSIGNQRLASLSKGQKIAAITVAPKRLPA